jgi:methyl-accepting chemotaxis protein
MGFFSRLFGHDEKKHTSIQATIRSEINISDAIAAHMKWKGRLQSYLDGTSEEKLDPMVICRDDQCVLGKWIHGPALNYFHNDEGFHKLRSDHANFHFVAGNVVKKVQEEDKPGADMLMKNDYAQASREVIRDLTELNNHLNDGQH